MKFLSFLKDLDNNRRRSKRIVINLLYLLIPLVILANTFSSDRIITECEEIHHYNTELEEEIKLIKEEYGISQKEFDVETELLENELLLLDEQRERIRLEVLELESQRDTILQGNSDLAEIAQEYKDQRDQARNQRDTLQIQLDAVTRELSTVRGAVSQCERENQGLEEQISNQATEIGEYVASVSELQGANDELQGLLNSQASDLEGCNASIKDLNQNIANLENDKDQLQAQIKSQATEYSANLEDMEGSLATLQSNYDRLKAECQSNASPSYEVNFIPIESSSSAFSKPAAVTLMTTVKYTVEVNGKNRDHCLSWRMRKLSVAKQSISKQAGVWRHFQTPTHLLYRTP